MNQTNIFYYSDYKKENLLKIRKKSREKICLGLPVKNEAKNLPNIIKNIKNINNLVDEVIVVDSGSTDNSLLICKKAGFKVIRDVDYAKKIKKPLARGKGWNLWTIFNESKSEIIIFIDTDLSNFSEKFLLGMIGPFLKDSDLVFLKAFYDRSKNDGRVTELVSRQLLNGFFPDYPRFYQPLSGEYGIRKSEFRPIFYSGYGVEIAILIQAIKKLRRKQIGQVYLGEKKHSLQTIDDLGKMSFDIFYTFFNILKEDKEFSQLIFAKFLYQYRNRKEFEYKANAKVLQPI